MENSINIKYFNCPSDDHIQENKLVNTEAAHSSPNPTSSLNSVHVFEQLYSIVEKWTEMTAYWSYFLNLCSYG